MKLTVDHDPLSLAQASAIWDYLIRKSGPKGERNEFLAKDCAEEVGMETGSPIRPQWIEEILTSGGNVGEILSSDKTFSIFIHKSAPSKGPDTPDLYWVEREDHTNQKKE